MLILHTEKMPPFLEYKRLYRIIAEKQDKNTGKNGKIMIQSFQRHTIEKEMDAHVV